MRVFSVICIAAGGLVAGASWGSSIIDADWISLNGIAGASPASVRAITSDGRNVYIGGYIPGVSDVAAHNVAQWDGKKWHSLGAGTDSLVCALACDNHGNLYAGGSFTKAGSVAARYVAKWDGATWSALGSGVDNTVLALACDSGGNLYAGGYFLTAGGASVNGIAKWDGSDWIPLGEGMKGAKSSESIPGHTVWALTFDANGILHAGGYFDTAGGVAAGKVARWDGSRWSSLGPEAGTFNKLVRVLAFDRKGTLYAGGLFSAVGDTVIKSVAQWDGSQWHALGTGINANITGESDVHTIACDRDGAVFVGGKFQKAGDAPTKGIAKWDGGQWSAFEGTFAGSPAVYSLAFDSAGSLYCGGSFILDSCGTFAYNIAKVKGGTACRMGSGFLAHIYDIAFDARENLCISGEFLDGSTPGVSILAYRGIAKRDGNSWNTLCVGCDFQHMDNDPGDALYTAVPAGVCIYSKYCQYIVKWNGSVWDTLGKVGMTLGGDVHAYSFDGKGNMYIGGRFSVVNDSLFSCRCVAQWDGSAWSALGSGISGMNGGDAVILAQTIDNAGNLYVAGGFDSAGGVPAKNIAKWDGTSWSSCATGIMERNIGLYALASADSGTIYAAGKFEISGGINQDNVMKWDGAVWSRLGPGMDNSITCIAVDSEGVCYAGGWFTTASGMPAQHVARWNGIEWEPLGAGTDGNVNTLVVRDSTLYAGGKFILAGDKASPAIAAVNIHTKGVTPVITPRIRTGSGIRCRVINTTLHIYGLETHDRIALYSISGRCVRQAAGVFAIPLSGLASQPLFVWILRGKRAVFSAMIMAP
jgi:hypothetical protein